MKRSAVQGGVVGASHVTCSKNMASTMFQCEECKIYFFSMEVFVRHPCVLQGNKHAVNQNHLKLQFDFQTLLLFLTSFSNGNALRLPTFP